MKIYAIRDRLLDYYQQPFIAQEDKPVLGAISNQLHNGENIDWQNAPHHFEIWRLGKVTPEGHLEQGRELLATLDSLIRRDLRRPERQPGVTETGSTAGGRQTAPEITRTHNGAHPGAVPQDAPTEALTSQDAPGAGATSHSQPRKD